MTHPAPRPSRWSSWPWKVDATGLAVALGLTALAVFGGYLPASGAQSEVNVRAAELAAAQLELEQTRAVLAEREVEVERIARELAERPFELQPLRVLNTRLAGLVALAEEHALRVDRVLPGEPVSGDEADRVPISLSGTGRFADVVRALHAVAGAMPDLAVEQLTLEAASAPAPGTLDEPVPEPSENLDDEAPGSWVRFDLRLVWFTLPAK